MAYGEVYLTWRQAMKAAHKQARESGVRHRVHPTPTGRYWVWPVDGIRNGFGVIR